MTTTPVPTDVPAEDTSDTPRRRHAAHHPIAEFNYLNEYSSQTTTPNTPHQLEATYDIPGTDVSSSSAPPYTMDETYGFAYEYPADQRSNLQPHQHGHQHQQENEHHTPQHHEEYVPVSEQSTPPALGRDEEDKTPVVTDIHAQPINLPCPPNLSADQTIRASHHPKPPLMSPFKAFHDQQQQQHQQQQVPLPPPQMHQQHQQSPMAFPLPIEHQQYLDNTALYYSQPGFIAYPQQTSPTGGMAYAQYPPQFVGMPPQMTGIFPVDMYQPQPLYTFAGPPRSRNGSPTSSIGSSAVSLARTGSTSSDFRVTRPKVKLTYEDKRNIVELHRQNSSLRQEDIARMYGVDRSTISKIILSSHRWTQPQEPQAPPVPKAPKAVGGRFPAVEAKLDEWMDAQLASGQDVRDNIAREKAKTFAREIGFPMDRFKASAKWLDKFKDRRKAAGKSVVSPSQSDYAYFAAYPSHPYPMMASSMEGGVLLSRSQSTVTLSSSDSSGQEQYQPPVYLAAESAHNRMGTTRSESDLINNTIDSTPNSRSRSQSSPHVLIEPGMQTPSSGKALKQKPTPLALQRQNSFHGTSPSPRRPGGLSRTNSIQGSARRQNRPLSLAASAFGFTNVDPTHSQSPLQSPTTSGHSRQRSDASVANGFSGMTISPNMSESGESGMMPMSMSVGTIPPLTPITPAHGAAGAGVFPNVDYGDIQGEIPTQGHGHYATMPNKHYGHAQPHYVQANGGVVYSASDFGPAQGYVVQPGQQPAWR